MSDIKKPYSQLTPAELKAEKEAVEKIYQEYKSMGLKLDMSRGKPSTQQLDMVSDILTALTRSELCYDGDIDARNYGQLSGVPSAKRFFAELLGCRMEQCFVGGNSSLTLMYDTISKAYTHGLLHSERPWCKEEKLKFLCPVPGYDRHFAITQSFGFEMINIEMTENGPDMDAVEEAVKDPAVKGIWCVPKYSNPDGVTYSLETILRMANLKPAAPDFTIMWDNAYCVHEFDGDYVPFPDILSLCKAAGRGDMVFEFASTSKITFPGTGISVFACSEDNMKYMLKLIGIQTISYDKTNQLRHVRYLRDKEHTIALMKKHAEIMKPKFDAVHEALEREIAPLGIAEWKHPKGGYFISLDTADGLAKRTWELCKEAGVVLTNAGATFPYGKDPRDRNIRIAPSYPSIKELKKALDVFCVALRLAALEQLTK
jgi:DNA-binding transcriptional MocR family regulator